MSKPKKQKAKSLKSIKTEIQIIYQQLRTYVHQKKKKKKP